MVLGLVEGLRIKFVGFVDLFVLVGLFGFVVLFKFSKVLFCVI